MPKIEIILNALLKERDLNQTALVNMTGIRSEAISKLARGQVERLSLDHLQKIMTALSITDVGDILRYVDESNEEESFDPLDEVIELLDLPPRIYNALNRNWFGKINTIRDLVETDLAKARNIGPSSRTAIEGALSAYMDKHK